MANSFLMQKMDYFLQQERKMSINDDQEQQPQYLVRYKTMFHQEQDLDRLMKEEEEKQKKQRKVWTSMHLQERLRKQLKINDVIAAILAVIGMIFGYLEQEFLFSTHPKYEQDEQVFVCRFGFVKSKYFKIMVIELIICSIHNPPRADFLFEADQMGKQLRYPFSTLLASAIFTRYKTSLADRCCAKIGIEADTIFSLKCSFKDQPFIILGYALAISSVVAGLIVKTFERPYYDDDFSPVPQISEQYQDYSFVQNGIWLLGLEIIILRLMLEEEIQMKQKVQHKAANALIYFFKYKLIVKKLHINIVTDTFRNKLREDKLILEVKLRDKIMIFSRERNRLKIEELAENVKIKQITEKVENDLARLAITLNQIREIDVSTKLLLQDQERDLKRLREINKNIKLFGIILNRLDPNSPGQKFISSKSMQSQKSVTEKYFSDNYQMEMKKNNIERQLSRKKSQRKSMKIAKQLEIISKKTTYTDFNMIESPQKSIYSHQQERRMVAFNKQNSLDGDLIDVKIRSLKQKLASPLKRNHYEIIQPSIMDQPDEEELKLEDAIESSEKVSSSQNNNDQMLMMRDLQNYQYSSVENDIRRENQQTDNNMIIQQNDQYFLENNNNNTLELLIQNMLSNNPTNAFNQQRSFQEHISQNPTRLFKNNFRRLTNPKGNNHKLNHQPSLSSSSPGGSRLRDQGGLGELSNNSKENIITIINNQEEQITDFSDLVLNNGSKINH
ncbi:UNKNOWN [Stylonychia lemnae]|uniref:Transmembrane protein n=1 Tax=Stylonychia lemnae TaxID=5949 RepID=A0A078A2B3_STYLE|nr:UNKNOWN [Stylonychia lemnae]|eukprot:CDW76341.1 UNKNOWN [Stylonychia lemnae]